MNLPWFASLVPRPKNLFREERAMAWVEKSGKGFRLLFRLNNEKYTIGLNETDPREVEACLARVEENLRFVERGRLVGRAAMAEGTPERARGARRRAVAVLES